MWWNDYIGIPFVPRGETRDGLDCAGLLDMVQREVFGRQVETLLPIDTREASEGDVLQMAAVYSGSVRPLHCGVVTTPGHVLHAISGPGVVHQKIDARLARTIIGAFRVG